MLTRPTYVRQFGAGGDITDPLSAEREQAELAAIVRSSTDAIIGKTLDGVIVSWNAGAERIYGYSASEVIGRSIKILNPPEHRAETGEILARIKRGESTGHFETTRLRKDGRQISVALTISPVRNQEGEITGASTIARDISERKRAEAVLREASQERRNRMKLRSPIAPIVVLLLGVLVSGVSWYFNLLHAPLHWVVQHAETALDEVIVGSIFLLLGLVWFGFRQWQEIQSRVVQQAQVEEALWKLHGDLETRVQQRTAELIKANSALQADIVVRKRAEWELRESEQRFRELAENVHEVFWLSDSRNARMNYISPAYEKVWGQSCESLHAAPTSWMEAVHPEDKEQVLASVATRTPNEPYHNTYRIIRPDGSIRWIRDRGFPVRDESGTVVRFAGIAEDITERKRAEQARERGLSLMLATLESTADGILVVNTEGKIETFNRVFARMWRLPDDVLASKEDARALEWVLDQLIEPDKFLEQVNYLHHHPEVESFDGLLLKDGRVFERYSRPQLISGTVIGRVWSFRDVTARRRAAAELEEANRQLRVLSRRHVRVQEDERKHLARELHDQIGQALTATKISVQSAKRSRKRDTIEGHLDKAMAVLDQLLAQVRQITLDLRPAALDDLGLGPALRLVLHDHAQRAGWHIRFVGDPNLERLDPEVETVCFRIALEALTNIVRHARAHKVWLELHAAADSLHLIVRDDGVGFDPVDAEKRIDRDRLGLIGMRERAIAVGGTFECISDPGRGTEVRASLPFHPG